MNGVIFLQINYFIIVFIAFFSRFWGHVKKRNRLFFIFSGILLIMVHSFVEIDSTPDLGEYQRLFIDTGKVSWIKILSFNYTDDLGGTEPLFVLYDKIVYLFTSNYTIYLIICSIIFIYSYYNVINKYSPYVVVSVLLFLSLTFNQSIFVLRQHMSVGLLFFSYPYIIKRDITRYLVVMVIACLVHFSSIVFMPIYFVYGIKRKKYFALCFAPIAVFALLISSRLSAIVDVYLQRYTYYVERNTLAFAIKGLIMLACMIPYCYVLKGKVFENGINKLVLTISALGTVYNMTMGTIGSGRIFYSLFIIIMLQIPITAFYIRDKFYRKSFLLVSLCVFYLWAYYFVGELFFYEALEWM